MPDLGRLVSRRRADDVAVRLPRGNVPNTIAVGGVFLALHQCIREGVNAKHA